MTPVPPSSVASLAMGHWPDTATAPRIPMPLPAEWVRAGAPAPTGHIAFRTADGGQIAGIWACGAGVFDYHFSHHETVWILAGEVTIETAGAPARTLRPGDMAHFPAGLASVWHVGERVEKMFVLVAPEASPAAAL